MMGNAHEVYVSAQGSDTNTGTEDQPLRTLSEALRKVRNLRRLNKIDSNEAVEIILKKGVYKLYEPIIIRPEDSGTSESPTIIRSEDDQHAVISSGVEINNWSVNNVTIVGIPEEISRKLWVADMPLVGGRPLDFRQLWVDGVKAKRATDFGEGTLDRILAVDKVNEILWIPTPDWSFSNIEDLELTIHQWWAIANLRVKSMEVKGDRTAVQFHQPESKIEFEHPWPAPFIDDKREYNGNSAFYFSGAAELLDQPGEWYVDYKTSKVYYYPQKKDHIKKSKLVVPSLETLVEIRGNSGAAVSHVYFKNIGFMHSTWMRPSTKGHVPLQAGWSLTDAYKLQEPGTQDKASLENQAWIERQPAAVEVSNANHIVFERCNFQHMAATGIDYIVGVQHSKILGNVFYDIGGTAIQAGFFGSPDFEAHLPYLPTDQREVVHHLDIENNYIENATNEDWGCVGISIGVAHDINVAHNEVFDVNYSGICLGWSWTKTISIAKNNRIHANRIHRFAKQMYDVGGIYTLSAQPNTVISENAIYDLEDAPYPHMPEHHQYIYFDEGSSYIRAENNWTEEDKFFSNSPGPGNHWKNNGPNVSKEIKENAGLEPEFQDIKP